MMLPAVKRYFCDHSMCLFRWTDEGRELAWANGLTIAFREELSVALRALTRGNLPGFVPFAVAMAISRDSWETASRSISLAVDAVKSSQFPVFAETVTQHEELLNSWPDVAERLKTLHEYFIAQPRTPVAKAEILRGIFQRFESWWSENEQDQIYEAFEAGLPLEWIETEITESRLIPLPLNDIEQKALATLPPLFNGFARDLILLLRATRMLASCVRNKSTDDIDYLIRTGMDTEIQPAPEEAVSQSLQTRSLLDELCDDPEYRGFAELTRYLMAAFSLPGSLRENSELPIGGVADLSNRGTLDRLLLSELAFDDLTLATRLALNEALFLKREVPPAPLAQSRAILLDNSLPVWGLPRVYIAAMGLAIQGLTPENVHVLCFRPRGESALSCKLSTRNDLLSLLEHLEAAASPAACLPDLMMQLKSSPSQAPPILITVSDVFENLEFRKQLDTLWEGELWIILAERTGNVTLLNRNSRGTTVTRKFSLPLESILGGSTRDQFINRNLPDQLPAILRQTEFPLRLSHHVRPRRVWKWGSAAVAFSDDGRIMLWTSKSCGAVQLAHQKRFRVQSQILLVRRSEESITFLVVENVNTTHLVSVNQFCVVQSTTIDIRLNFVSDVVMQDEVALVFGSIQGSTRRLCSAIHPQINNSGQEYLLGQFEFGNRDHARVGRIYKHDDKWCALTYVGGVTTWVSQVLPADYQKFNCVAEFASGFLLLDSEQRLSSTSNPELSKRSISTLRDVQVTGFAGPRCCDSGSSVVLLTCNSKDGVICIDTQTGMQLFKGKSLSHRFCSVEYHLCSAYIQTRTPRYLFTQICLCSNRQLLFIGARGNSFTMEMQQNGQICFREVPTAANEGFEQIEQQTFAEFPRVPETGVALQKAEFSDGSMAWLDSRGLLHLKSCSAAIPEITFVMTGEKLSGWLSSSEVFGDDYYCEPFSARSPSRVDPKQAWVKAICPYVDQILQGRPTGQ